MRRPPRVVPTFSRNRYHGAISMTRGTWWWTTFSSALLLITAAPLTAQTRLTVRLGVTGSTHLIEDQIVAPITVKPSLAPTLTLGASLPAAPRYDAGLELAFSAGGSKVIENGVNTSYGTIKTLALTAGIDGPLISTVRWRGSVGILKYWGSSEQGIFRQGGPTAVLVGLGAEYRHSWQPGLELIFAARYDWHRFTTDELKSRGFTRSTDVHRVGLSLGITRSSRR